MINIDKTKVEFLCDEAERSLPDAGERGHHMARELRKLLAYTTRLEQ